MRFGERLIPVVTSVGVKPGRCKYCDDPILWVTRASQPGRPAKTLPFNRPQPFPLRTERNDETGLVVEYWPAMYLHFSTCPNQPPRRSGQRPLRLHA